MTWATIYTAIPAAGDVAEGREYAMSKEEWKGEAAVVSYDEGYDRMPRVKLSRANVVPGSVVVTLKTGRKVLELADYTSEEESTWYQSWPTPAPGECYLHRRQGEAFDEAWLYFNPDLLGMEINVDFDYYETAAEIKTFVDLPDGSLGVNESGPRHRFLRITGMAVTPDYSPRFGDSVLEVACLANKRVFGISSPSWLLVSRGNYWPGYVSVPAIGQDAPIWTLCAELARAGDCYLFAQGFAVILRNRDSYPETSDIRCELDATSRSIGPYRTVVLSYANGDVAYGSLKPILSLSAPFVYDKGHAQALCKSAYDYYAEERKEYNVRSTGILDDEVLLAKKKFVFESEAVSGHVKAIRFGANNTTLFLIVGEIKPRAAVI